MEKTKDAQKPRKTRKVRRTHESTVTLSRISPWSVMRVFFIYSFALGVAFFFLVNAMWVLFETTGMLDKVNEVLKPITTTEDKSGIIIQDYLNSSKVLSFSLLVSITVWTCSTLFATFGAIIYNCTNSLIGGFEITLSQPETANPKTANIRKSNKTPENHTNQ